MDRYLKEQCKQDEVVERGRAGRGVAGAEATGECEEGEGVGEVEESKAVSALTGGHIIPLACAQRWVRRRMRPVGMGIGMPHRRAKKKQEAGREPSRLRSDSCYYCNLVFRGANLGSGS